MVSLKSEDGERTPEPTPIPSLRLLLNFAPPRGNLHGENTLKTKNAAPADDFAAIKGAFPRPGSQGGYSHHQTVAQDERGVRKAA